MDLFIAEPGNWGNVLAIRTGNAAFSKGLVTERRSGGLMPPDLYQRDGFLWCRNGFGRVRTPPSGSDERLECPTEEAFFAALGLPTLPPAERDEGAVARLWRPGQSETE